MSEDLILNLSGGSTDLEDPKQTYIEFCIEDKPILAIDKFGNFFAYGEYVDNMEIIKDTFKVFLTALLEESDFKENTDD